MTKKIPTFDIINANGTKSFRFDYKKMPLPRIGDHIVIYSNSENAKTGMEGKVTQVIWIIGDDTQEFGVFVIIEEGKVPHGFA